jgi:hypothetical protein
MSTELNTTPAWNSCCCRDTLQEPQAGAADRRVCSLCALVHVLTT